MDSLTGEIKIWPGERLPMNFMFCNGDLLNIIEYKELYDIIENRFGGDGEKTFALPNMNEGGANFIICVNGVSF